MRSPLRRRLLLAAPAWALAPAGWAQPARPFAARFEQILTEAAGLPQPRIVLLGDSITQQLRPRWLREICGLPVLNAGVSGAGIFDFDPLLPGLLRACRPALVVVAVGVNDGKAGKQPAAFDLDAWRARYLDLVRQVRDGGARVLLSVPLPLEPGKSSTGYFDAALVEKIRTEVRALAQAQGLPLSDAQELFGEGRPELTFDGVHLNGEGLQRWSATLERDVRAQGLGDCARAHA
ncbi:MAG: hypothetical protein EPO01_18985 [Aquabacterium sp.]|nr:MAG: hypothetical protein EPO01_18985 [Aquabacterium sp.]